MIKLLKNSNLKIAETIRYVFQKSYKIESKLLNAIDFPPLKRPLEDYLKSENQFFGYFRNDELAGVVEIIEAKSYTHIRSLVVNPLFFRQGIAQRLMEFTLTKFDSDLFIVETGVDNQPASKLYLKLGFKEVKQWDTSHGIRKVKFELRKNK